MVALSDFNFLSDSPIDKAVVNKTGSVISTNFAFDQFTIPNPAVKSFIPSIMYSYDGGTSWYKDGAYEMYWDGNSYRVKLRCYASSTDSTITITVINGYDATFTVQYRVYGVSKNV